MTRVFPYSLAVHCVTMSAHSIINANTS
uniref:Uncharacterized protein n=1 Tax=Anguilla anguilla TaxID=7936 RepID=A0A0E9T699_ANGAN